MKNIYLREGGYWFSKMTKGERVWVNLNTADMPEAIRRADEIRDHPLVKPTHTLLSDARRFLAYKAMMNRHTLASSREKIFILKRFCDVLPASATLANVTTKQINAFHSHLQQTKTKENRFRSPSTILSYMMTLQSFFRWAHEVERVRLDNPVKAIPMARSDAKARLRWVDRKLKNKLLETVTTDDLRFILFSGFDAGLRRGEISEARADWFDLKQGLLHVRRADGARIRPGEIPFKPKDRDERTIPLSDPFRKFLGGYLKRRQPLDFALVPAVKHGKARYRYDFRRPFNDYMKSQKQAWITPHVMRHSFASILASADVSIFKISEWLGDDVRVVQRHYAKLAHGDKSFHQITSG